LATTDFWAAHTDLAARIFWLTGPNVIKDNLGLSVDKLGSLVLGRGELVDDLNGLLNIQ